jgi:hypothetical protein
MTSTPTVPPSRSSSTLWWAVYVAAGVATVAIHAHLARSPLPAHAPALPLLVHLGLAFLVFLPALRAARRLGGERPLPVLFWCFLVAGASLVVYLPSSVLVSSEVTRYQWNGDLAGAGFNPYEFSPDDPEVADLRAEFPGEIPHPEQKAIYPPLAEILFYVLSRTGWDSLFTYRLLFSTLTLLCGVALLRLCAGAGVYLSRVTVFLWHPLLILESGANAHLEVLPLFFLLLSLGLLISRHQLSPMGFLGISSMVRIYPVALLPLYVRRVPFYRTLPFLLVVVVSVVPFIGAGRDLVAGAVETLSHARFNPGGFLAVEALCSMVGHPEWSRLAVGGLVFLIAVLLFLTDDGTHASILRRAYYLALPPILLGPVVHPWYLVWLIPFLALVPTGHMLRFPILYLSGSVLLAYTALDGEGIPAWATWVEYGPVVLLAVVVPLLRRRWGRGADPVPPAPSEAGA